MLVLQPAFTAEHGDVTISVTDMSGATLAVALAPRGTAIPQFLVVPVVTPGPTTMWISVTAGDAPPALAMAPAMLRVVPLSTRLAPLQPATAKALAERPAQP